MLQGSFSTTCSTTNIFSPPWHVHIFVHDQIPYPNISPPPRMKKKNAETCFRNTSGTRCHAIEGIKYALHCFAQTRKIMANFHMKNKRKKRDEYRFYVMRTGMIVRKQDCRPKFSYVLGKLWSGFGISKVSCTNDQPAFLGARFLSIAIALYRSVAL